MKRVAACFGVLAWLGLALSGCSNPTPAAHNEASKEPVVSPPVESAAAEALAEKPREGQAPPELKSATWLNTAEGLPLSWDKLKGKVVLLDLWAYW